MYEYILIYVSMWELYFEIYVSSFRYLSIFSIYQDAYLNVNSLYIKSLHKFFLPDVASIAGCELISVVLSVTVTVGDDDEANKVQFVLIDASDVLTKTLKLYCITNNTLPFLHIIYIYEMY